MIFKNQFINFCGLTKRIVEGKQTLERKEKVFVLKCESKFFRLKKWYLHYINYIKMKLLINM